MRHLTIVVLLLLSAPTLAHSKRPLVLTGPGVVQCPLRPGEPASTIEVKHCLSEDDPNYNEDCFLLTIKSANGAVLHSEQFNSSYERFRLSLVDLAGDGEPTFVFELCRGRGTFAAESFLLLKRWEHSTLVGKFEIATSRYIGKSCESYNGPALSCRKAVTFVQAQGNATHQDIRLTLKCKRNCPIANLSPEEKEFVLYREQTLRWNPTEGRFFLINGTMSSLAQ